MKRRTLLGAGLGAAAVSATPSVAQDRLTLSLLTDRDDIASALAARISTASGGRITVDISTSGTETADRFLDDIAGGNADLYLTSQDAFVPRNPAMGLFSAMPAGMSPSELESWVLVGDGQFMWDILGEEFGIKPFMAGDDGAMPMWSRDPITSLSDLTGGPIGSKGLGLSVLADMGVTNPVDLMTATDLSSLTALEGFSIAQMAEAGLLAEFPHMTTPNAGRPSAMLSVGFNLNRWSDLSEADQLLIERCIMAEHGTNRALAAHRNVVALSQSSDIISHAMPQDIWDAQIASANNVMAQMFDAGDAAADAADTYLYFIGDVAGWSEIGETAYFLGRKQALSR